MAPELILINEISIVIVIILALVLFGGSRIAGVGKGAGRAIREFKEETKGLEGEGKAEQKAADASPVVPDPAVPNPPVANPPVTNPTDSRSE